jgi:hypothetical protein
MSNDETFPELPFGGGALFDSFDLNDEYYVPKPEAPSSVVDLRKDNAKSVTPVVYDQGKTYTCTANATAAAFWHEEKSGRHVADWGEEGPSRLFTYWLARGGFNDNFSGATDSGSSLRDAMKGVAKCGACAEGWCRFPDFEGIDAEIKNRNLAPNEAKIEWAKLKNAAVNSKPKDIAFQQALNHKIAKYLRLDADRPDEDDKQLTPEAKERIGKSTLKSLKKCLFEGFPVAFSFWFYRPKNESFDTRDETWILEDVWHDSEGSGKALFPPNIPLEKLPPQLQPKQFLSHSVLAIGYDDNKRQVLVQNSYGPTWGNNRGVFLMPYAWILDFEATNDFWTIRVNDGAPTTDGPKWKSINKGILGDEFAWTN